jgi:O-acetyl-ADP-ribose deacetylase (regulator of RNase III)
MPNLYIEQGDITGCRVDAIVNAANNDLILGGGLAGVIRRRGGPDIQEACNRHGPIRVGQAAITTAGLLPARYVIHQASMALGGATTEDSLRESTAACLKLADQHGLGSIAFPATGTGIGGFDTRRCAQIMLGEVLRHLRGPTGLEDVHFLLYDEPTLRIFQQVRAELEE